MFSISPLSRKVIVEEIEEKENSKDGEEDKKMLKLLEAMNGDGQREEEELSVEVLEDEKVEDSQMTLNCV